MITFIRILAVAVGAGLYVGSLWLIWEEFAPPHLAGVLLSILSLFVCIVAGGLFGEHFCNFINRRHKKTDDHAAEQTDRLQTSSVSSSNLIDSVLV